MSDATDAVDQLENEHVYTIQVPMNYGTKSGGSEQATFITLLPPSSRNAKECAFLQQAFFRAVDREMKGGDSEGDISKVTGADVIQTIAMSRDVTLGDVYATAETLFTKGKVALVEGEVSLTKPIYDRLSMEDVEGLLGDYLVFFILASSLQRMRDKSTKGSST